MRRRTRCSVTTAPDDGSRVLEKLSLQQELMWIVDTDKLTTANGGTLRRAQPDSVANHVKARQSLIERAVT